MSNIFHKIGDKFERAKTKMGDQVDELQGDLSRLKVAAAVSDGMDIDMDISHTLLACSLASGSM